MSELVMAIRRQSQGFTRGSSAFRGVTQHKTGAGPPGQGNVPFLHLCPALAAMPVTHVRTALCPAQKQARPRPHARSRGAAGRGGAARSACPVP